MRTSFAFKRNRVAAVTLRAVPAIIVVVLIAFCFSFFAGQSLEAVDKRNTLYVTEYTQALAEKVDVKFSSSLRELELIAASVAQDDKIQKVTPKTLGRFEERSSFDFVRYVDSSACLRTSTGQQVDSSGRDYFENGMQGQSGITFVEQSRVNGNRMVAVYTPCVYNDEVVGVFVGLFAESTLEDDVESFFDGQKGSSWVVTREGESLVVSGAASLEKWFDEGNSTELYDWVQSGFTDEQNTQKLVDAYTNGTLATFNFSGGAAYSTGCIIPLDSVDWSLVVMFPSAAASQLYDESYDVACHFAVALIAILVFYIVVFGIINYLYMKKERQAGLLDRYLASAQERTSQARIYVDLEERSYIDVSVHPLFKKLTGTYDEMVAYTVATQDNEISAQDLHTFLNEKVPDCKYNDEPPIVDATMTMPDGSEKITRATFVPVESVGERVTKGYILLNDVTRAKRREKEEREKLEESLEMAQAGIRAKNEFLACMSHDLHTPLNAILGYSALAKAKAQDPVAVKEYTDKINAAGADLLVMVDELLEAGSMSSGDAIELSRDVVELDGFLDGIKNAMSNSFAAKKQTFAINCGAVQHRAFIADEAHLHQVLVNLLENACRYTLNDGKIDLRVEELPSVRDGLVSLRFTVADNGIGITKEYLPHVFDAFSREQASIVNPVRGTGLGLSMVKRIVEAMDGTVSVNSKRQEGTTFTVEVSFPIAHEEHDEGLAAARFADALQGVKLLAAEDNDINAEILVELLAQEGASCKVCSNGREVLGEFAQSEPGTYDAVLMDVMMPEMNGLEAARAIRVLDHPQAQSIPIIAMTANNFKEDRQRSSDAGMNAHLGKPIDMNELKATIAKLLG